ncbi:MAG: hypothetical protein HUU22_17125 [Phycisphaerae bacterium]|nr:hypothetical protein [Phycisphaerae bacterium]NUQ47744.1 hypothetical protein [Phycisphaerae bacterium]
MPPNIYGIRHHGPGCAKALGAALQRRPPDILLIEGPPAPPQPPRREEIGLKPDENGMVAPMVWFLDRIPSQLQVGRYHVDDRFEFFMVAEPDWILPFDTDEALRDRIGADNIFAYEFAVEPDGLGNPIAIHLHRVRLEDAITVLTRLGANEINVKWPVAVYQLRLDGTPEDYNRALLYLDGHFLEAFPLR